MRWSILFFLCFNLSNGYSQIIESHPLSKDSKLVALPLSVNTPKEIDNLVKTDNLSKDINNKSNELTHNRDATDRNATMNGQKNNLQIIVGSQKIAHDKQLKKPDVRIGMNQKQVINNTKWGAPLKINTTITKYGTNEQWVYWGYKYLYFENGKLIVIQK